MSTESVTATPAVSLKLQASVILNKAKIEKSNAAGFGALGAWGKMLMVFKAMMGGNALLHKESKELKLFNMLRGIVYNTVKDCTSLSQLQQYFESIGQQVGTTLDVKGSLMGHSAPKHVIDNMFKNTPGYASFVDQMSHMIGKTIAGKPAHGGSGYEKAEFSIYQGMFKSDNTRAQKKTQELQKQAKDMEGEQTSMNNAMDSLTSMAPIKA